MAKLVEKIDRAISVILDKKEKYLIFTLADREFGISIINIKDIIEMMPVMTIPQKLEFVVGVIHLRSRVIPIVDLRLRFGMERSNYTERTCIVIVEIPVGPVTITIGIVVDSISEVLNIRAKDIKEIPTLVTKIRTDYILGEANLNGGVKILIDINKVLSCDEVIQLGKAA